MCGQDLWIKISFFGEEAAAIRSIRQQVFHQEQGIDPALDFDGLDDTALHLTAKVGSQVVGVARLREIEAPLSLKLERLAVLPAYRQQGLGSEMVYTVLAYARQQDYARLVLHAQASTVGFYQRLGFQPLGVPFHEAGIPHLKMAYVLTPD